MNFHTFNFIVYASFLFHCPLLLNSKYSEMVNCRLEVFRTYYLFRRHFLRSSFSYHSFRRQCLRSRLPRPLDDPRPLADPRTISGP